MDDVRPAARARAGGLLLIAILCLFVAVLVAAMAAPDRRLVAIIVVSVPFTVGATVALRGYLRARRDAATRPWVAAAAEGTIKDFVPDVDAFITSVPRREASFAAWAADRAAAAPRSMAELEDLCIRHGAGIELGSDRFLDLLAAYGELVRRATSGRWARGLLLCRGEPVVVSGRFPHRRVAVLRDAVSLLDAAADFEQT